MNHEDIIQKVQKLLEFQKGAEAIDSPEEAANAAEKVRKLLTKYNLTMEEVGQKVDDKGVVRKDFQDITNKKNEGQWIFDLYWGLAKYNFCKIIIITEFQGTSNYKSIYKKIGCLIGEEYNVLTVKYLGEQLEYRLRAMARKAWKEMQYDISEKKNAFMRGYFRGATSGIKDQLYEQQQRQMQEQVQVNALVHLKDKKVDEAVREMFPNLKSSRASRISATGAYGRGRQDGKNISINKGVEGGRTSGALQ